MMSRFPFLSKRRLISNLNTESNLLAAVGRASFPADYGGLELLRFDHEALAQLL